MAVWTGVERNSWAMSIINMMFHGVVNFKIKQGDTLVNPQHKKIGGAIVDLTRLLQTCPFRWTTQKIN